MGINACSETRHESEIRNVRGEAQSILLVKINITKWFLVVETQCIASLQLKKHFGPQSKNLASIIRGFKIGVTKNARSIDPDFAWQSRYHDHIIRDDSSYHTISEYIVNNPMNWAKDKFYTH